MTLYEPNTDLIGEDEKLVVRKLKDGCWREMCMTCRSKFNLYDLEYDITEYTYVHYGVHCRDCAKKIFKVKEKSP